MNIVLFEKGELERLVPSIDPRYIHVMNALKVRQGETFDAGVIDGLRGKARVERITPEGLELSFEPGEPEEPLPPIHLVVGLSRPQANRRILREASSLGVASICFTRTEKGEPSYAASRLWTTDEWRRQCIAGISQAFSTRLPEVSFGVSLSEALCRAAGFSYKLCLDNYESAGRLKPNGLDLDTPSALAIGSERGWSSAERQLMRRVGFELVHLGKRPLRVETAVIAAVSLVLAEMG